MELPIFRTAQSRNLSSRALYVVAQEKCVVRRREGRTTLSLQVSDRGTPPMKLLGCMLGALSLLPCASSFMNPHIVGVGSCFGTSAHQFPNANRAATRPRTSAWGVRLPLRLGSQNQKDDAGDAFVNGVSEFEQTSGPVKAFVGGLTNLFVGFSAGEEESAPVIEKVLLRGTTRCGWQPPATLADICRP